MRNIIFNGGTLNTTADFTLGANKGITMTGAGTIDIDAGTTLTLLVQLLTQAL